MTLQIIKRLTKDAPENCLENSYALEILICALNRTIQDDFKDTLKELINHTRPKVFIMHKNEHTPLNLAQDKQFNQRNRAEIVAHMKERIIAICLG